MAKKTQAEQSRHLNDTVYTQWSSRPAERRRTADLDGFVDDLWGQGTRLASSQNNHRQAVMDIIRLKVIYS